MGLSKKECIERYTANVQKSIAYCESDQPRDDETGEVIWVRGDHTELSALLEEANVSEAL